MLNYIYIAILPIPVFYLIYFRHFFAYYRAEGKKPAYLKHLESFLFGIALALVIILLSPYIDRLFQSKSIYIEGFIKAALIEKLGAFIVIYIVQKHYPGFNILEAIISGILAGAGFSLVENILYNINFGQSVIIIRILFSVPLHITTCGLIGYFIGLSNLSSTGFYRYRNIIKALVLPYILHGLFDFFILTGGASFYLIAPMIIILVLILEIFIEWSKIVPSRELLREQGLRFEDWLLKYRQPRYERWILNSMGTAESSYAAFFTARRGKIFWMMVVIFFVIGISLFPIRQNIAEFIGLILNSEEQILIASIYPVSIALILSIVGSINPKFFTSSVAGLPIIFDVVLCLKDEEQNLVTFDITHANCFLRTFEPLHLDNDNSVYFESRYFKSPKVKLKVIWENHQQYKLNEPTGTIVQLKNPGFRFYLFLMRYYLFRFSKGLVFNLKLPGFQVIRSLFMRPVTVMQKEIIYQPGSLVFRQGDQVNTFYYIKKGKVNFYKELASGDRILIDTMGSGQIFNEMALLGNKSRTVTVECETLCVLAEANVDNLEALIRNNPDFASALVRKLAQRADQTQNYLTQTIDYLQELAEINTKKAKNVILLLAIAIGKNQNNTDFEYELNLNDISKTFNIKAEDIIEYIKTVLFYNENNKENKTISSDTSFISKLEKSLSSLQIGIIKKNEKLVLSFSFKKEN
jgi:protease PrsW